MATDWFFQDGSRVLTPRAFEFVLASEVKRAVRAQNFLTLVVVEARREWDGISVTADQGTVGDVARIVGNEVRDTDLLGGAGDGALSLVLLDADYEGSCKVIVSFSGSTATTSLLHFVFRWAPPAIPPTRWIRARWKSARARSPP